MLLLFLSDHFEPKASGLTWINKIYAECPAWEQSSNSGFIKSYMSSVYESMTADQQKQQGAASFWLTFCQRYSILTQDPPPRLEVL